MRSKLIAALALSFLSSTPAWAVTALKQVRVLSSDQIELTFDRDLDMRQVKSEFIREIVQLNLSNVSVYPPKILPVNGEDLLKVFAYQYTPNLVRCRLTIKGNAGNYTKRLSLKAKGKVLTIKILPSAEVKDRVLSQAAQAISVPAAPTEPSTAAQDKIVMERIIKSDLKSEEKSEAKSQTKLQLKSESTTTSSSHLTGRSDSKKLGKEKQSGAIPSILRAFGMLVLVIVVMGAVLMALRTVLKKRAGSKSILSRMLGGKFGKSKMIEMVATHYLGPNKSIAVVKVEGRKLVLGVTDKSINLITQFDGLGADPDLDELIAGDEPGAGAVSAGPSVFMDVLGQVNRGPVTRAPQSNSRLAAHQTPAQAAQASAVREQIRKRLEGMKPL